MKNTLFKYTFVIIFCALGLQLNLEASRIKDITLIHGNRENQLIGYGLVIGLNGKGDSSSAEFTKNAIANSLERMGVKVDSTAISVKNAAAVMVTADIPPYARTGARINIVVSSMGDAKTLQGGVLLQTPLRGADNIVYAVAQGPIAVGGFLGGTDGEGSSSVQQNHPTVGMVSGGAIVEREIDTSIMDNGFIDLVLRNPDFTSAVRIADALNNVFPACAKAESPMSVTIKVPQRFEDQEVNFLAQIEGLEVTPDVSARVVINERTGTIVATSNVRISTVAISHGSLTITISSQLDASQANSFAPEGSTNAQGGETVKLPSTQTTVHEVKGGFTVIPNYPNIERLTTALNALGVTSREMMSIMQTLKQAGALQAELILN